MSLALIPQLERWGMPAQLRMHSLITGPCLTLVRQTIAKFASPAEALSVCVPTAALPTFTIPAAAWIFTTTW
jgi:hypothetical protein